MGFVEFERHEDAQHLIDENPELELDGRNLGINWAGQKEDRRGGDRGERGGQSERTKTIFVGSLSYDTTEDSIRNFFSECGNIESIRIAKAEDGKPKGFCHIDFSTEEEAEQALAKNGEELDGRTIKVDKTLPRGSGGSRGGRGGFRDRDGGRFGGRGRGGRGGDRGFRGHGGFRGGRGRGHY